MSPTSLRSNCGIYTSRRGGSASAGHRVINRPGLLPLVFLILFITACGGRTLNKISAEKLLVQLPEGFLDNDDVTVESVTQVGESTVVEARVRTAFRFEKTGGKWVIKEIRVGNGQWEDFEAIMSALNAAKTGETRKLLAQVVTAIEMYREKTGKLPQFTDFVSLTDLLNPIYLEPLVRLDAWSRPFAAEHPAPGTIKLLSAGPDGQFGTPDDIELTRTFR